MSTKLLPLASRVMSAVIVALAALSSTVASAQQPILPPGPPPTNDHHSYLLLSEYIGVRDGETRSVLEMLDATVPQARQSESATRFLAELQNKYDQGFGLAFLFEEPNFSRATVSYIFPCRQEEGETRGQYCITLKRFSKRQPCPGIEAMNPQVRLRECYRKDDFYGESGVAGALDNATLREALAYLHGYLYEIAAGCGACNTMRAAMREHHLTQYPERILGGPDMEYHTLLAQGVRIDLNEPSYWSRTGQIDQKSLKVWNAARTLQENHLVYLGRNANCGEFRGPRIISDDIYRYIRGQCAGYMMGGNLVEELFEEMEKNGFLYIDGQWARASYSVTMPRSL